MDDLRHPAETDRDPTGAPLWPIYHPFPTAAEVPAVRLILQPSGRTLEVTSGDILIGRHSEADVRLPLPDVSRRHCRLVYAEGSWRVFDLHSLNGVFVNGEQVEQAFIHHGDKLRVGGFVIEVEFEQALQGDPSGEQVVRRIIDSLTPPEKRQAG